MGRRAVAVVMAALVVLTGCMGEDEAAREREYLDQLTSHITVIELTVERVGVLMSDPRPTSDAWAADITRHMGQWIDLYEDAQGWDPPERFERIHERHIERLSLLNGAANDIASSYVNNNPALIDAATAKLLNVASITDEITVLLNDLAAEG